MNWFLVAAIVVVVLALAGLTWRLFVLRPRAAGVASPVAQSSRETDTDAGAGPCLVLADDSESAMPILIEALPDGVDIDPVWDGAALVLGADSGPAKELTRLGLLGASGGTRVYSIKIPPSAGRLLQTKNGRFCGDLVSVQGKFVGKATSASALGRSVGPQIAWAALTFAVGQQYEKQISGNLRRIEDRLRVAAEQTQKRTEADLEAALEGCRRAGFLIINGAAPSAVLGCVSSQTQEIDSAWIYSKAELQRMTHRLESLRRNPARTSRELVRSWPGLYTDHGQEFTVFVADFMRALNAKIQLIVLESAWSSALDASGVKTFLSAMERQLADCRSSYESLLDLIDGLSRHWFTALRSHDRFRHKEETRQVLTTQAMLADLHRELLGRVKIPFVTTDSLVGYELVAAGQPDGSVRLMVASVLEEPDPQTGAPE